MNKKFVLALLSSPALFASMLSMVMMTQPASATQTGTSMGTRLSCVRDPHSATHRFVCMQLSKTAATAPKTAVKVAQNFQPNQVTNVEFTEEESNTAIALFGCDCVVCINAVRQMRGQTLIPV
ncbi:hypothetical protein WA1_49870 [Scytonema hofmannii PCC 7110]|uniref:Uncharacterized protein n=1 Tax=Scytonema hofmannii PCC 7110 TaxID=128403 RepID=A0A139WQY3_9CYAN|nr:hypothetical protein [Scytonema hofmannii]KYC34841.1 hypothetical protein WA1_49870 [Scytonema hofmannii PCC 7110]